MSIKGRAEHWGSTCIEGVGDERGKNKLKRQRVIKINPSQGSQRM